MELDEAREFARNTPEHLVAPAVVWRTLDTLADAVERVLALCTEREAEVGGYPNAELLDPAEVLAALRGDRS